MGPIIVFLRERIPHRNRIRRFDVDLKINEFKFHGFCWWTGNFIVTHSVLYTYINTCLFEGFRRRRRHRSDARCGRIPKVAAEKKYLLPSDTERRYCDRMINVYIFITKSEIVK